MRILKVIIVLLLLLPDLSIAQAEGEFLFNSSYDFLYSNSPYRYIEMIDTDSDGVTEPVVLLAGRISGSVGSKIYLFYKSDGIWESSQPFQDGSSFHGMQYCSTGPLEGKIIAMANKATVSSFAVIDPENWQFTIIPSNDLFLSFVYLNDGSLLARKYDNPLSLGIYKSTDNGSTFNYLFNIGDGDPAVDLSFSDVPAELPFRISKNGQHISIVGAFGKAATSGVEDVVYKYYSNDFGITWQGKIIGRGSGDFPVYGQISNRNYAPYFTNFGQLSFKVDNPGNTHVVINGYGSGIIQGSTDTTEVFPILYWNDSYNTWFAVTNPEIEYPSDGFGNTVRDYYPGSGIGNAYPSVAITPDGKGIFILWQTFEHTGGINTPFNIFPGDNSSVSTPVYYTDLMLRRGIDHTATFGGIEWSAEAEVLAELLDNSRTEQYPILAPIIEGDGVFIVKTHFVYQYDAVPGLSLFPSEQNLPSDSTGWYFKDYVYLGTSIDDGTLESGDSRPREFVLYQNYPNPFNPTTVISYSLPVSGYVSLKVFDVLGREVYSLVEEYKSAGKYEVKVEAEGLTSGLYLYRIQAGNYVETKKMMLVR